MKQYVRLLKNFKVCFIFYEIQGYFFRLLNQHICKQPWQKKIHKICIELCYRQLHDITCMHIYTQMHFVLISKHIFQS